MYCRFNLTNERAERTRTMKTIEYSVSIRAMRFDTCGGRNAYEIDGMKDPMELEIFDSLNEARLFFNESKQKSRSAFKTETMCGGCPCGYAVTLERNVFDEYGDYVDDEMLDCVEYTCDDWNAEDE